MTAQKTASYGSWKSPVTSSLIASGAMRFDAQIALDGEDVYWTETRPAEAGRSVIVCRYANGKMADITPAPFSARTRVHEYGGGSFLVDRGVVYFSNFADQRLYRINPNQRPEAITDNTHLRFADGVMDRRRRRIVCVCEDHSGPGQAVNSLLGIEVDGSGTIHTLVSGNDFYSSPRLSPEGDYLAWLTWNHPNMPWDYTELWLGRVEADGSVGQATKIAGGVNESICQPKFSPEGTLYFISERTGWWNIYRWVSGSAEAVCPMEAEFGAPDWVFGLSNYTFTSAGSLICSYISGGVSHLATINTKTGDMKEVEIPYTSISSVQATAGTAVLIAGSANTPASIVRLDPASGRSEVLRRSTDIEIEEGYLSVPLEIEFPTEDGLTAHAVYYKPNNQDFAAPDGERPPLLVVSHGGPTSAASTTLNLTVQYWTSRGFAVADVNYGGSTGYGRGYRQRLDGKWGIVDVDDCVNCARYLIDRGEVDERRTIIRGGSAGGYTTLAALTFHHLFRAGASYYGVSDLEGLAKDTHKFESRYLDRLIGPYPERRDLYLERSPINHVDRLSCPIIFLQGDEDKVVPPSQAETMVSALRRSGVPVAYLLFEGEQHGFRQAGNIRRALDAELYFYSRIFEFALPEPIEAVTIENL